MTSTSPRRSSRRSTPGRETATRCPASARSTGRSCTCTLRTRTVRPRGSTRSSSPSPIVPDQSVPVATVPIPRSVKERSTWSRVGPSASCRVTPAATSASAARSSSSPVPVRALVATTGVAGDELLRLDPRELERLLVDGVGLRERDDAVLDPEQPQDREVLVRLRPRSLAGVDHEQEEVDAARARDHRADEALVAGDVDDGEARAVRQLERRVAEVDRDPALVLLGQPVGVLAGQRLDERRLAVVDVTRGADGQRHRATIRLSCDSTSSLPFRAARATAARRARGRRRGPASAGRATSRRRRRCRAGSRTR